MTTDYTNGNWHAATLGEFVSLLIDSGGDPAVIFRVVEDEPSKDGAFVRHLEVMMLPQGRVKEKINQVKPESIHNTLVDLIKAGVVK